MAAPTIYNSAMWGLRLLRMIVGSDAHIGPHKDHQITNPVAIPFYIQYNRERQRRC